MSYIVVLYHGADVDHERSSTCTRAPIVLHTDTTSVTMSTGTLDGESVGAIIESGSVVANLAVDRKQWWRRWSNAVVELRRVFVRRSRLVDSKRNRLVRRSREPLDSILSLRRELVKGSVLIKHWNSREER